jgi:protein tyrosine phosphatase
VQARFAAGEHPDDWSESQLRDRLRSLLRFGLTFFLDLTEPGEKRLRPYHAALRQEARSTGRVVQYRRVPIPDFETPSVEQMRHILDMLDAALVEGYGIYVHCYAGIGRTGTVVGCFLVRHGWSGRKALDEIVALRRGLDPDGRPSPITPAQRAMVLSWAG